MQKNITLDNHIRLLLNGSQTLSAIMDALTHAKHCINLEYFSFHDDETGNIIADILTERASHGVRVRMLIDAAGSWRLSRRFIHRLVSDGVEFKSFMPFTLSNMNLDIIHRDHRKIITVDNKTGFLGGFNIGDIYLRQWRDTHIEICGSAVNGLDDIFFSMWNDKTDERFHADSGFSGSIPVEIIASGQGKNFRAIADRYVDMISDSRQRIWITTPYFVPDKRFLSALCDASLRGVDVRVIIPSTSNHMLVSWASQSYIDALISRGVKIFIYQGKFIHAKTIIADSDIASVGTANLDALSFSINYEVQAFIYSHEIVRELEAVFISDLENCSQESSLTRRKRPISARLKECAGRLLAPVL